ncbi:hypothetical protein [Gracilibacillus sp. YIM 98692]|uniref:hypothetical protein n=1 Tax=Gracilibacillus sp. YIM 98692 TaxID=2663532 RepID=UPI0013D0E28D|nr:hypothetical protein [Gracilibacillus sp. YIM 98692]
MYKPLQAFFKTEDDAETVKALLNKLKANDIVIDQLPDGDEGVFLVPLAYSGSSTNGVGAGSGGGVLPLISRDEIGGDEESREFVLECEVAEEDYQESLKIVMENDGYVDKKQIDNH